jgi:hypothetical protein
MSGSILNNAVALMEVDRFSVVEFQNHFPPDDDIVVKGTDVCIPGVSRSKCSAISGIF